MQVWLRSLPPESKRRVRAELRQLAAGRASDVKALRGEFEGFLRLRVGDYRIVYHHEAGAVIKLDYADTRDRVYDVFRHLRALSEF